MNLKNEKITRETELGKNGTERLKQLEAAHQERKKQLLEEIASLESQHKEIKGRNMVDEKNLNDKFELAEKGYKDALETYDADMREYVKNKETAQKQYDEDFAHLKSVREQWEERLEENRKRNELQKIIDDRKEKQQKVLNTLHQAAQFLQAHWRGLGSRREMEKARKGKKGRKRAKK